VACVAHQNGGIAGWSRIILQHHILNRHPAKNSPIHSIRVVVRLQCQQEHTVHLFSVIATLNVQKVFIKSVAIILFITAALKILTLIDGGRKLDVADPLVFFLSNRALITLSTIIELIVVLYLTIRMKQTSQLLLILWLSCVFLVYHLGLWASGYQYTCYCAGKPFSWLVIIPFDGKTIIRFLLGYMLIGSGILLLWDKDASIAKRAINE